MPGSITSANAVLFIAVSGLFPIPQQLQGFAADDVYGVDALESVETTMGVDGKMSAGFVFVPIRQMIALQADSPSNTIFENLYAAQQILKDAYRIQGITMLPSIGRKYIMANGVLSSYPPLPDAKKVLQMRRYGITWESVLPSPV